MTVWVKVGSKDIPGEELLINLKPQCIKLNIYFVVAEPAVKVPVDTTKAIM
jgi:hypothetical protein